MSQTQETSFLEPLNRFLEASNGESDRGKVLVSAAQIDGMLEEIIRAFLIKGKQANSLFDSPNAPCSSMFSKANLAFSMGLISPSEYLAIEKIRRIRNEFAHSVTLTMTTSSVADKIMALEFGVSSLVASKDPAIDVPQNRFQMCVISLIGSLYNRAHHVGKKSLKSTEWPQ